MKEHNFTTLQQISELSQDEFNRMIPDLCEWFRFSKKFQDFGAETRGFIWIDDGKPGNIEKLLVTNEATGEVREFTVSELSEGSEP
jgi:hypothetical protein